MKAVVVLFASLAFVLPIGGFAAAQQPQGAQKAPPPTATKTIGPPTFNVGEFWEYHRPHRSGKDAQLTRTVTEIRGDLLTMVDEAGRKRVFTKEGNEVEGLDRGGLAASYDPFVPRLEFPLQEGRTWARSYAVRAEKRG